MTLLLSVYGKIIFCKLTLYKLFVSSHLLKIVIIYFIFLFYLLSSCQCSIQGYLTDGLINQTLKNSNICVFQEMLRSKCKDHINAESSYRKSFCIDFILHLPPPHPTPNLFSDFQVYKFRSISVARGVHMSFLGANYPLSPLQIEH